MRRALLLPGLLALAAGPGLAGDLVSPPSPEYREECGSCHVAYPPRLLDGAAWARVMAGLAEHFGTDASLEPASRDRLAAYLAARAAPSRGNESAPPRPDTPRITTSAWFLRKHRDGHDGLHAALWRTPAVGSPANCGACHRAAAEGRYGEHEIQLPVSTGALSR